MGFKVRYLHSEIDTLERIQIIRDLRLGEYDVLVGVNLLREGLDLPEVSLVAILDADKEGFLRGETSLVQTIGRAARNVDGHVLMYADKETAAMRAAIGETDRRRAIQVAYNEQHGITATTIVKGISDIAEFLNQESKVPRGRGRGARRRARGEDMQPHELERLVVELEEEMLAAAADLRFEQAARLRDELRTSVATCARCAPAKLPPADAASAKGPQTRAARHSPRGACRPTLRYCCGALSPVRREDRTDIGKRGGVLELDRQSIQKKDFPIGRRGYDADAVDAHLAHVAGYVDDLRRVAQQPPSEQAPSEQPQQPVSLATAAAMQVQAIVEAAESTAADIRRQAQEDAQRTDQEAADAAQQTRDQAVGRAQAHVDGVAKAASVMLQRVAAMESELGALIESLKSELGALTQSLHTGTDRLTADLTLLSGNMAELYDASGAPSSQAPAQLPPEPGSDPAAAAPPAAEPQFTPFDAQLGGGGGAPDHDGGAGPTAGPYAPPAEAAATAAEQTAAPGYGAGPPQSVDAVAGDEHMVGDQHLAPMPRAEPAAAAPQAAQQSFGSTLGQTGGAGGGGGGAPGSPDVAGARMIALNMALNGQPREEADRYLADNFDIPDRQALIDEVYSALDG